MPSTTPRLATLLCLVGLTGATGSAAAGPTSLQPAGWDADIRLAEATDLNPDPRIVEVNLDARVAEVEIAPGLRVSSWTYNGGLPGPLIRANVGDRLIVRFSNKLPKPTTVHWHGVRVPIEMDGVPGNSQPEVETGQSFTYDFIVPDAGLFWYHPHVMSAAQVGFGLYGALLVEDPEERIGVADQLVLVLSDIAVDDGGLLEDPESGGPAGMVFGREGNHVLVNGREGSRLVARNGAPQRWRIANTSKSRHFQLELDGIIFTTIGGDGGLQEYPEQRDRLVLAAGERADVILTPRPSSSPGGLVLRSIPFDRGYGSTEYRDISELVAIEMADLPPYAAPPLARVARHIEPLSQAGATRVAIDLTLAQLRNGEFEYGFNGIPFSKEQPIEARIGETQLWTVTNKTKWSHPLHLHGFFFQVVDDHGDPVRPLAWKDTVNIPYERTLRLLVRFDDRPGNWMVHCHILDHADGGLMGTVRLRGDGVEPARPVHRHR